MTPEGMVTHRGPTYRRHPSPAHASPNTHSGRAMASNGVGSFGAGAGEGAAPVPAGTVMMSAMPTMVMTRPANRARFCSALRRISHNAAAYKVTPAPTATAATASVVPYTWYI